MKARYCLALLLFAAPANAQVLVLEDSLRGSTSGTQNGGTLGPDGWRVTQTSDYVYWHIPTLRRGAVEFSLFGIRPQEGRPGNEDKTDLFHMYDWTFDNADTNYNGYRNNPFKHFIRKTGVLDTARVDSCELVWVIAPDYIEPDTPVLSWDPNTTYRFREEWGPDGAGNAVIRTYRDGVEIMTMSVPGEWAPAGHAIKIGVARLTAEHGAPLDAVFSDLQVWDLSQGPVDPGLDPAPHDALPQGRVRVVGNSLVDDNGAFLGQGATYMTALWQMRNDRALLESDLALLRSNGFNYIRILGQVGGPYWAGLEIEPLVWPDYVQQLQDLLDVVWSHGMRTEITIFGGADQLDETGRQTAVDLVLQAVAGREEKVILIEVANEGWQTGFPGAQGLDDMRAFAAHLDGNTGVPVAITSNHGINTIEETYTGASADIATWHTSRDLGVDGGWGPVWDSYALDGPSIPPVSSNEPIGPGSSVNTETEPIRLVMAAAFAWVAKLPMYVFHSSAGVRHVDRFEDMAGLSQFGAIRTLIRGDVASWQRNDGVEASAPFTSSGAVRNTGARRGDLFVTVPIGIGGNGLTLEARQAIAFQVYDPLNGTLVGDHSLGAGQSLTLPQGPGAYVITNVALGDERGLTGHYHLGIDLQNLVLTRRDRRIDFDWGEGTPSSSLPADGWSIRWSGTVNPRFSETYTFHTETDDGVRLWIDGQLLVDDWNDHGPTERTGTISLSADREVPIVMEYYENVGTALARLSWSSASQGREVIPPERLLPQREHDAVFVAQQVPETMQAGQPHRISITLRNIGSSTWNATEFALAPLGIGDPIGVSEPVPPFAQKTFEFDLLAPETPGTYDLSWQMAFSGTGFGHATPSVSSVVAGEDMPPPDAGTMMMEDPDGGMMSMSPDATVTDPPIPEPAEGCSCSSHRTGNPTGWLLLLLMLGRWHAQVLRPLRSTLVRLSRLGR